jgi:hypothetical protein
MKNDVLENNEDQNFYIQFHKKINSDVIIDECRELIGDSEYFDVIWFRIQAFGYGTHNMYLIPMIENTDISINSVVEFVYKTRRLIDDIMDNNKSTMQITPNPKYHELYRSFIREVTTIEDEECEAFPDMIKLSSISALLFQLYGETKALFKLNTVVSNALKKSLLNQMKGFEHEGEANIV